MKKFAVAAVIAAGFATSALAQDNPAFTGFRVEGLVGYDRVGLKGVKDPDGFLYGVGLGYDFAAGGALVGLEAEASDSTSKVKLAGPDLRAGRDLYVGARVGAVMGANLVYLKGGYTNARIKFAGVGDNGDGVRLGVGVEHALSTNAFVKAEYRYSNYESDVTRQQLVAGFGYRF